MSLQGQRISDQSRDIILHVYQWTQKESQSKRTVSTKNPRKRAADYCAVAESTISELVKWKKPKPGPKPSEEKEKGEGLKLERHTKILAYNLVR